MRGFTTRPERVVTLERGAESVSLRLTPYPAGFRQWLGAEFPPPTAFENGKPVEPSIQQMGLYYERVTLILLAQGLGEQVDTKRQGQGAVSWQRYADDIRDEFRAANLTDGELNRLAEALNELVKGGESASGNS